MVTFSIVFLACVIALFFYNISTLELTFQHVFCFFATLHLCYMAHDLRVACTTIAVALIVLGIHYLNDPDMVIAQYYALDPRMSGYTPTATDMIVVANAFLFAVGVHECCDSDHAPLKQTTPKANQPSNQQSNHKKVLRNEAYLHLQDVLREEAYHQHKLVTLDLHKKLLTVVINSQSM
jgi:hypothetical protein